MRTPIDTVEQAAAEELWWGLDWGALGWLPEGDTIVSAVWSRTVVDGFTEDPPALVLDDDSVENGRETWVRLTSPTSGVEYIVTVTATTSSGEIGQQSLRLRCP